MLVPKLRFKREDGTSYPEWSKDKWSNLGSFVGSGTLSKSDLAEEGTPCILYGELYTKYGEIAHTIYSKTSATSHTFSQADDVILPKSGETPEDISTATCIPYDGISLGGDLIVFRHNEKVTGAYLSYLISNRAKNAIASIAQGKSVVHINEKALSNIELPYPQIEEQQKIADFLSAVDEVIAQSEAEVQNLEQQKKAAMQKIFSQEVRFKREDGSEYPEWEEIAFSELYKQVNEKNDGSFGTDKIISVANMYFKQDATVGKEDYLKSYNICRLGDIAFEGNKSKRFAFGRLVENDIGDGIVSHVFIVFRPISKQHNISFWKIMINYEPIMGRILAKCTKKSTMMTDLVPTDFLKQTIIVPCDEEQQKIADFLSAYDEAIRYAKQELEHWKQLKKGLLQQMFV